MLSVVIIVAVVTVVDWMSDDLIENSNFKLVKRLVRSACFRLGSKR